MNSIPVSILIFAFIAFTTVSAGGNSQQDGKVDQLLDVLYDNMHKTLEELRASTEENFQRAKSMEKNLGDFLAKDDAIWPVVCDRCRKYFKNEKSIQATKTLERRAACVVCSTLALEALTGELKQWFSDKNNVKLITNIWNSTKNGEGKTLKQILGEKTLKELLKEE